MRRGLSIVLVLLLIANAVLLTACSDTAPDNEPPVTVVEPPTQNTGDGGEIEGSSADLPEEPFGDYLASSPSIAAQTFGDAVGFTYHVEKTDLAGRMTGVCYLEFEASK